MEANKEQLVDNIMANFVVIKDLLHEDNLGETDVSHPEFAAIIYNDEVYFRHQADC